MAMKSLPNAEELNRHDWRRLALKLQFKLEHALNDYDTLEAELKQLTTEREACTCREPEDKTC